MSEPVPLVRVFRGRTLESLHRGSFAIWAGGGLVRQAGDVLRPVFYRSTAKPFQALVTVTSGAATRFGLGDRELAVATGSHNASALHLETVRSILAKATVREEDLACGGHLSIHAAESARQLRELPADAATYPAIWSNCSGKHACFLAAARALGAPTQGYLDPGHPVQQAVRAHLLAFAGLEEEDVPAGTDGCGAPIYAVPLRNMARSLALLGAPEDLPEELAQAARKVTAAMVANPEMVAGDHRFDTDLMLAARGQVVAKGGAEGVEGVAVPRLGLGIAVKVDDGSDRGYRLLVIALLKDLGVLTAEAAEDLAERHGRTLKNHAGTRVGRAEAVL